MLWVAQHVSCIPLAIYDCSPAAYLAGLGLVPVEFSPASPLWKETLFFHLMRKQAIERALSALQPFGRSLLHCVLHFYKLSIVFMCPTMSVLPLQHLQYIEVLTIQKSLTVKSQMVRTLKKTANLTSKKAKCLCH